MVSLFRHLHHVTQNCANLNNTDQIFPDFSNKHLFYDDDDNEYLHTLVYSGIKPSMGSDLKKNIIILGHIFYRARNSFKGHFKRLLS